MASLDTHYTKQPSAGARWLTAAGILALAFVLRMVALDGPSLRGDEAFAVMGWAGRLDKVFGGMAAGEPHPPLTFVWFSGWVTLVGRSELAARYLSVLAGMLSTAAVYGIGQRLGGRRLATVAALLWVVNPFQVWHAQDARNYALWTALSALALLLMLRAMGQNSRRAWALYVAFEIVALYTFYLEAFMLAVQNLYALVTRRFTRQWIAAQAAITASLVLLGVYLLAFVRGADYSGTAQSFDLPALFTRFAPVLAAGDTLPGSALDALWPVMLALLGAGTWALWRRNRRAAVLVVPLVIVPLVMLSVFSLRLNVFRPRYVIASAPAYALALAALVVALWEAGRRARWASLGLLAALLILDGAALAHHYADPAFRKSPNWRGLVAALDARVQPDDILVQNESGPAIAYYFDGEHTAIPDHAGADPAEVAELFEAVVSTHRAVWFLPTVNPSWDPDQNALHWLEANAQQIDDTWVGSFRVQQWRPWAVSQAEIDAIPHRVSIGLGDFATLTGYEVYPPSDPDGVVRAAAGDASVRLVLYWSPAAAAPMDYTAFVHLTGPINPATGTPLWSQDDHPPQHGRAPTSTWQPGEVLRGVFTLDLDGVPPGSYTVSTGFYDPATDTRVDVAAPDAQDNAAMLFTVEVAAASP
jgi:hypothetical protein